MVNNKGKVMHTREVKVSRYILVSGESEMEVVFIAQLLEKLTHTNIEYVVEMAKTHNVEVIENAGHD